MFMMLDKLNSLNRTNKLLLAYMVNPECMLEATRSEIVVSNAMKASKAYKGESAQVKEFFRRLSIGYFLAVILKVIYANPPSNNKLTIP